MLTGGTIELNNGLHIALTPGANGNRDGEDPDRQGRELPLRRAGAGPERAPERGLFHRSAQGQCAEYAHHASSGAATLCASLRLEEVTVQVDADDDCVSKAWSCIISINGGGRKLFPCLGPGRVKDGVGKTMISLEDYKLELGYDVVSVYATARDARNTSRTDMVFIETQPYERNYSQSQQGGGGGGRSAGRQRR